MMVSIEIVSLASSSGACTAHTAHIGHATGTGHTTSTGHTGTTSCLVDFHHDGVEFSFHGLLLLLELGSLGIGLAFEPLEGLGATFLDGFLVLVGEFVLHLFVGELVLHLEAVVLELVFLLDLGLDLVILVLVLLGIGNHLVNLFLGETSVIVGDGDLLDLTAALLLSGDVEDTVGINVESDLNLGDTAGCGGDSGEVELSEEMAVLGLGALAFEDLDGDSGLLVSVGSEGLGLLGGDGGVPWDKGGHDTTGSLDSLGEGGNINKEHILDGLGLVTGENGGLDGGTVGNGLIGVDGSVELLAVEEVGEHGLDLGDSGGTTDENDLVDLSLGGVGVGQDLLYGGHALSEEINAEFLESGTVEGEGEVLTFSKSLALDDGLMGGRESSLGLLALGAETTESAVVALDIDSTGFLLEFGHAELDESVVEIFATEMGVPVGGLDLEDTILNGEEGNIESTTTEIEDEDVTFAGVLLVETVRNSGGGGLVDDSLDRHAGDGAGVLGGLTLGVVEVGGDGDDSVGALVSEVSLGDFLHLGEDHGGDLLGLEFLHLTLVLDDDHGLLVEAGLDLEGPELDIILDSLVRKLASDESLGIEDSVGGVSGDLRFGGISNETLILSEGHVGGGGVKSLIVGDDLNFLVSPDTDA